MDWLYRGITGTLVLTLLTYPFLIGLSAFRGPLFWLGILLLVLTLIYGYFGTFTLYWKIPIYGLYTPLFVLYCLSVFVLVPFNYPPGQPPDDSAMIPEPGSAEAEANFDRLNEQFRVWSDRHDTVFNTVESSQPGEDSSLDEQVSNLTLTESTRLLVERTADARDDLLEFLINEPAVRPEEEWGVDGEIPQVLDFISFNRLGLLSVKMDLEEGRPSEASQRFTRLWKANTEFNRRPSTLIEVLVAQAVWSDLIDFYGQQPALRDRLGESFVDRIDEAHDIQGPAAQRALSFEYVAMKDAVQTMGQGNVSASTFSPAENIMIISVTWPIFDQYRTLGYFHRYHGRIRSFLPEPYHEIAPRLNQFHAKWVGKIRGWSLLSPWNMLTNPMGRFLFRRAMPNSADWVYETARVRSRLTMARVAGTHSPPVDQEDIPTDELSGESYEIDIHSDSYVIRSPYSGHRTNEPVKLVVETE